MAGKYDVHNTEELLTLVKLATISILQAIAKDGFQPKDLAAFLKSGTFEAAIAPALKDAHLVIPELSELDMWDGVQLAKFAYGQMDDILTEIKLAGKALKK